MSNLEVKNGFNWREFTKIVVGITLSGAGLAVIVIYRENSVLGMTIGFALLVVEWNG